jgi:predicted ribonuclease YlaK
VILILDKKSSVVLDTSALMENYMVFDKAFEEYEQVIINIVTIEELDHLKENRDILRAKKARKALAHIERNKAFITFVTKKTVLDALKESSEFNTYNPNDDIIVTCALLNNANLCTEDFGLKIKAEAIGVECVDLIKKNRIYTGYQKYAFTTDEYNDFFAHKEDYYKDFCINEYLIIEKVDEEGKTDEYRFDGTDFVRLKLPSSKTIKAKNALQRCALDMLNNNDIDICAVLGEVGSGKTFLALRMALNAVKEKGVQSKILGVRSPDGEGARIGFLRGDFEDKTKLFFLPLVQSLDGGEYELQELTDRGIFETMIPYYMKGTTYNDTIIVCDEAEDLSEKEVRLVGTRLGEGSRIFFSGDYNQAIMNATTSNPLIKMCDEFKGNPKFACICLDTDVRSDASKMFANLYKNNG